MPQHGRQRGSGETAAPDDAPLPAPQARGARPSRQCRHQTVSGPDSVGSGRSGCRCYLGAVESRDASADSRVGVGLRQLPSSRPAARQAAATGRAAMTMTPRVHSIATLAARPTASSRLPRLVAAAPRTAGRANLLGDRHMILGGAGRAARSGLGTGSGIVITPGGRWHRPLRADRCRRMPQDPKSQSPGGRLRSIIGTAVRGGLGWPPRCRAPAG